MGARRRRSLRQVASPLRRRRGAVSSRRRRRGGVHGLTIRRSGIYRGATRIDQDDVRRHVLILNRDSPLFESHQPVLESFNDPEVPDDYREVDNDDNDSDRSHNSFATLIMIEVGRAKEVCNCKHDDKDNQGQDAIDDSQPEVDGDKYAAVLGGTVQPTESRSEKQNIRDDEKALG